jgi:hypothetical protein
VQRDLGTFRSLRVNNFSFFIALLLAGELRSGVAPWGAFPFIAMMGLPLLFPVSADPLDKIPAERLALWPLSGRQRLLLRLLSLAMSPIFWIMMAMVLKKGHLTGVIAFAALAIGARGIAGVTKRVPHSNVLQWIPLLPGRLGGVVSNNLREMLGMLDTWVAVLLGAVSIVYRFGSVHRIPDPSALPILAMLIALALSTYAQSLFGLDFEAGLTLYRLLPLRAWEVLFAKDIAFMAVLLPLIVALDPLPALTFGLASLAIGHHSSVRMRLPQRRWRFAGGRLLPVGALQVFASVGLGMAEMRRGPRYLALTACGYLLSLWFYGRGLPDAPR